jgi:hypothetical protein
MRRCAIGLQGLGKSGTRDAPALALIDEPSPEGVGSVPTPDCP